MNHSRPITRRTALAASTAAIGCSLLAPRAALADEGEQTSASSEVLDFLYIDNKSMYVGEAQNVVVCLKGPAGFESATLTLTNVTTGEAVASGMTTTSGSSMLFSFAVQSEGTYEVTRLDYAAAEGAGAVDFTDYDASYRSFAAAADEGVSLMSDGSADAAPELRVYAGETSGDLSVSGEFEEGAGADELDADADAEAQGRSVDLMAAGDVVIALDPGHVAVSSGAVGVGGTQEAACTWKIAQYCREELENYQGVSVVYTVTPDSDVSGNELQARVSSAVAQGASVLVSLHLNSTLGGSDGKAYGAEIYVPYDAAYNSSTHTVGEGLAKRIIAELEALGLYNRGVKIRTIDDDDSYDYANGIDADYYGIIRYARQKNLPAIIVEHAFVDNPSDYERFLSSDAKLRQLGRADAQGIIKYFGLSNEPVTEYKMYRLYNPNSGEHFYTASTAERNNLTDVGWVYEGIGWIAPKSSESPVYRLYNPNAGDHHYTLDASERDMLASVGWVYEGAGWCSDDNETIPIYRQYNPNAVAGAHNFTTDPSERDMLVREGWVDEGVAWYAKANADGSTTPADPNEGYNGLSTRTPIMAATTVSAATMAAYYRGTGATYPADVYTQYGAPTIDDFCSILVEEADREGVCGEVLFAQVSIETGNLRFGGQVKANQCNFGGLGATDGGASGADFSIYGADGVRMGLRAQTQHLKAYASKDPLNSTCVDPRFSLVNRGIAPMVENLGNGNWATDKSYASKLLKVINALR